MPDIGEEAETAHVCPVPECDGGQCETREESATQVRVSWSTCTFCDGAGVVPIWKAAEYKRDNPLKRKISGLIRRPAYPCT
jgi:hypothetical protein